MTKKQLFLKLGLELIWWLITAIATGTVLYPILKELPDYAFLLTNIAFIAVFITFTRYIFLLQHVFFAHWQYVKVGLIFLCIPIGIFLSTSVTDFQRYLDEHDLDTILAGVSEANRDDLMAYIRNEMIFFGVGSTISAIIFPIRMVVSIWTKRNRGAV